MDPDKSASTSPAGSALTPSSIPVQDYNMYPDFNHNCLQAEHHTIGRWCSTCERLGMPFGGQLPLAINNQNLVVMIGPAGSVLEGVQVTQPRDVETVALLCLVRLENNLVIPQLDIAEQLDGGHFQVLLEAAKRLLRLMEQLEHDARGGQIHLHFTEIIETALHRPTLSPDQLKVLLLKAMSTSAIDNEVQALHLTQSSDNEHAHIDQDENLDPESDIDGDDNNSDEDSDLGPDGGAPKIKNKSNPADPVSDELDRLLADNPDYDLFADPSRGPTAPNTEWRFVEGHDSSRAQLGKPDTSKFFVHRELVSDPSKKDIRHYIDWEGFDWFDQAQVERLNKWRNQLNYRTKGKKAEPSMAWTLHEKEELKKAVEGAIQQGGKVDWEEVRKTLHKVFEGVVQKKGEPLAIPTSMKDGKFVESRTRGGVLKTDRTGFPQNRGPKALSNKSHTFHDIHVLVGKRKGDGSVARKAKKGKTAGGAENEGEKLADEEEEEEEEPAPKKRKLAGKHPGPKDPNPGSKPGPPPPPPAAGGNAGTSAGAVFDPAVVPALYSRTA